MHKIVGIRFKGHFDIFEIEEFRGDKIGSNFTKLSGSKIEDIKKLKVSKNVNSKMCSSNPKFLQEHGYSKNQIVF